MLQTCLNISFRHHLDSIQYGISNVAFAPLEQKEAFRGLRLTKMGNQDMR